MKLEYDDKDLGPVVRFSDMFRRAAEKCADPVAGPLFETMRDRFSDTVARAMKGEFARKADTLQSILEALGQVSEPLAEIEKAAQGKPQVWSHYEDVTKSIGWFGKGVVDGLAKIPEQPSEKIVLLSRLVLRQPSG